MSASAGNDRRNVLPRWRQSITAIELGELGLAGPGADADSERLARDRTADDRELEARTREFAEHATPAHAADLLGSALVLGRPEAGEKAARFLVSNKRSPRIARELARGLLKRDEDSLIVDEGEGRAGAADLLRRPTGSVAERNPVRSIRRSLSAYPRSPLLWVDLALHHTLQGRQHEARNAIAVALSLAPEERFVIRSAARFFVHVDEPDHAHDLLRRSTIARQDPWVAAAELATAAAANRPPTYHRLAREMSESGRFRRYHTSELASALGTLAWRDGDLRRSRKWFRSALDEPTENAIAQATWVATWDRKHDAQLRSALPPRETGRKIGAWEAEAIAASAAGDWQRALTMSARWFSDQPFSAGPASHGSYIAELALGDYNLAIDFARAGLRANPREAVLLNNLAVALASDGQVEEAENAVACIHAGELETKGALHIQATRGLIRFRRGDAVGGELLYRQTIADAIRQNMPEVRAMANLFLAREMFVFGTPGARETLEEAKSLWQRLGAIPMRKVGEAAVERITKEMTTNIVTAAMPEVR